MRSSLSVAVVALLGFGSFAAACSSAPSDDASSNGEAVGSTTNYGTCTAAGTAGTCIDTGACASQGGTSTAHLCPGPSNIECCTGGSGAAAPSGSTPPAGSGGQQCVPSTVVKGVDLNPNGDGTLNWGSSGTSFAIIKATQGTSYTDANFTANWAALKSSGVIRGAYHFFDATVSGVTQANHFLSVVGTFQAGDLPPVLDIECPVSGESDCLGNGSSGAAPSSQITQGMNDFLNTVKSATGLVPIVYSFGSWFEDNGVDTAGLQTYPLWLADYSGTSCFNVPAPWSEAAIWQYNSSGTVSGDNVDDNYFLGSLAQLEAFTVHGSGSTPGTGLSAGTGTGTGMGAAHDSGTGSSLGSGTGSATGTGTGTGSTGITCSSDGDCNPGADGSGMFCKSGFCVVGCNASWECPGSTSCVSGKCK